MLWFWGLRADETSLGTLVGPVTSDPPFPLAAGVPHPHSREGAAGGGSPPPPRGKPPHPSAARPKLPSFSATRRSHQAGCSCVSANSVCPERAAGRSLQTRPAELPKQEGERGFQAPLTKGPGGHGGCGGAQPGQAEAGEGGSAGSFSRRRPSAPWPCSSAALTAEATVVTGGSEESPTDQPSPWPSKPEGPPPQCSPLRARPHGWRACWPASFHCTWPWRGSAGDPTAT